MSFNSDMKVAELHEKIKSRSKSGAVMESWRKSTDILVSIYEVSAFQNVSSVRYSETSHRAITFARGIKKGQKLITGAREFEVLQVMEYSMRTTLMLKEVSSDV